MRPKTALRWPGLRSIVTARYLSRRIGRSQNGMGGCFSEPFPLAVPPPAALPAAPPAAPPRVGPRAGSACGAGAGVGLGAIDDRCRTPAPDHPVEGQAGAGAAGLGDVAGLGAAGLGAAAGRGAAGPEG